MRRLFVTPIAFLAAVFALASLDAPPAAAQPPAPEEESFLTADGVQLKGLFHATDKNANSAPVVILMYAPGPDRDMTKGDWAGLAKRLNEEGYHAFRFDWRGHGKSTKIDDTKRFWENPFLNGGQLNFNSYIRGGPPRRPTKNDILYKDLVRPERYVPAYLTDLAAVRAHLDTKNDNKTVNTSTVYLIGTGDAATIGLAWLTAEWQRPAVYPTVGQLGLGVPTYEFVPQRIFGQFTEAGQDVAGAVWLSASRPTSVPELTVRRWVSTIAPKLRDNNPMLFLYADKDRAGKAGSDFFYNDVLVANPRKGLPLDPLDQTFMKEVKGGNQASGVKLLGDNKNLKTEDTVVQFMAAIQKSRAKLVSKTRGYSAPYYINLREYGLTP